MYLKEIYCEDLNRFHPGEDVYKLRASLSTKERICRTAERLVNSRSLVPSTETLVEFIYI